MTWKQIRAVVREVLTAFSSVVFLDSPWMGVIVVIASFLQYNIAVCGLIGVSCAWMILRLFKIEDLSFRKTVLYNGILCGLYMGFLFKIDGLTIPLIAIAECFCFMMASVIGSVLAIHYLPTLSLPFTVTAVVLSLARAQLTNLTDATPYFVAHIPAFLEPVKDLLKSMGSIFCIPDPLFGLIIIGGVACASPLLAVSFIAGYEFGELWESLLRFRSPDIHSGYGFNYALSFAALSFVYFYPSRVSLVLALLGTLLTNLIAMGSTTFWEIYHIPMIPFAFNMTVLIILKGCKWSLPNLPIASYAGTPEATLDRSRLFRVRQRSGEIGLFCPFDGQWQVQQGFDGERTHRGNWKHALDFVQLGKDGKTFKNKGYELEDYHCFGKPVLAPAQGVIAATCTDQEDSRIGTIDNERNWGNYIIIRTPGGIFIVLAHLKENSIQVKLGDVVSPGQAIAKCGNSGYSPEPHLHLQIQWLVGIGSYTSPFHLINYKQSDKLVFHGLPIQGEIVEPFNGNVALERALSLRIGEKLKFKLRSTLLEIEVKLDAFTGELYFQEGSARLNVGSLGSGKVFYSFLGKPTSILADLLRAAPRIPLVHGDPIHFVDALPLKLESRAGARAKAFIQLLLDFDRSNNLSQYRMSPNQLEIFGPGTHIKLDPQVGILEFSANGRVYVRET